VRWLLPWIVVVLGLRGRFLAGPLTLLRLWLRSTCGSGLAASLTTCALAGDRLRGRRLPGLRLVGLSSRLLAWPALPTTLSGLHHLLHQRPEDAGPTSAAAGAASGFAGLGSHLTDLADHARQLPD
jgi:hypothetical protein